MSPDTEGVQTVGGTTTKFENLVLLPLVDCHARALSHGNSLTNNIAARCDLEEFFNYFRARGKGVKYPRFHQTNDSWKLNSQLAN